MQNSSPESAKQESKLAQAKEAGFLGKLAIYGRMSGPGWVQSAVTLGGGSLVGALYLGIIGGTSLLWVQPLAILCGVILLSSIAYVTLSTKERPFLTVGRFVSPTLAWLWLLGTIVADVVFCAAQIALAVAVITKVIAPDLASQENAAWMITPVLAIAAWLIAVQYKRGGSSARFVETTLKIMVAVVVVCFFISTGLLASKQNLDWSQVFSGFIPDFGSLFRLSPQLEEAIANTGNAASYWRDQALSIQRNNVIAAFGSAVGINMTWLLPYTLIARNWGKQHREYSRFDLGFGLLLPFIMASASLALLAAMLFHAKSDDILNKNGDFLSSTSPKLQQQITKTVEGLLFAQETANKEVTQLKTEVQQQRETNGSLDPSLQAKLTQQLELLPEENWHIAAILSKRKAPQLASTLEPLLGSIGSRWIFGIGVLAMAFSTMIVHMMMNGFAVAEAVNKPNSIQSFASGAALPALCAAITPLFWASGASTSMVITAAIIATVLLPIAYLAFLLLMNSKRGLGAEAPKGRARLIWNLLLWPSFGIASFACVWKILNLANPTQKWIGLSSIALLFILVFIDFVRRQNGKKARPSLLD